MSAVIENSYHCNYQTRKAENDKDDARRLKDINERF